MKVKESEQFQFSILLILTAAINTGLGIIVPILPNLLKSLGFSTAALSLPFLVLVLGRLIKPYAGKALQKFSARDLLVVTFFLDGCVRLLYIIICTVVKSPEAFIAIRFLEGVVEGTAFVVLNDLAISLSSKSPNRGQMMGYFSSAFSLGFIFGPLIGSLAFTLFGISGMFLTSASISFLGVLGAFTLKKIPPHAQKGIEKVRSSLWSTLTGNITLLAYYSPNILRRALFFAFMIILPIDLHERLELPLYLTGIYFSGSAVISTLLMPMTGKLADKYSPSKTLAYSLVAMGLLVAGFGLTSKAEIFTLLFALETITFAIMLPAGMKVFADLVENNPQRGAIIGIFSSIPEFITLVLALIIPPLYALSAFLTWMVLGGMCLIAALPFINYRQRGRLLN